MLQLYEFFFIFSYISLMSFYVPISNVANDMAITKPLPTSTLYSKYKPVTLGPKYREDNTPRDYPYIENFQPPVYQPNPANTHINNQMLYMQGTTIPQNAPQETIKLRNEWEVMNTTNAVAYGGFDIYNVKNIPSYSDRAGAHLSFADYSNPMFRVFVNKPYDYPVIRGMRG